MASALDSLWHARNLRGKITTLLLCAYGHTCTAFHHNWYEEYRKIKTKLKDCTSISLKGLYVATSA